VIFSSSTTDWGQLLCNTPCSAFCSTLQVFGHGFLTKDGLKMGKALGNTLDPEALVNAYGPDAVRLFFMKEVAFGQDGNFSEHAFRDTVNATLANSVGNMLNRTLAVLRKNYDAGLPYSAVEAAAAAPVPAAVDGEAGDEQQQQQHPLVVACEQQVAAAAAAYGELAPHRAVEAVLAISAAGNLYLEQTAPWTAFKRGTDADKAAAGAALVTVLETARILAVALSPITPGLSSRIYQQLGLGEGALDGRVTWSDTAWGQLQAGHRTADPQPVFARLDDAVPYVTEPAPGAAAAAAAPAGGKGAKGAPGSGKKQQQKQQKQKQQKQQQEKEAATAAAAS
jgi:methionyl-tRNA synthetase